MASYLTVDDVSERVGETRLIELTDDEETGSIDADKVEAAIAEAEGEVNSYLARQYAVPVDLTAAPEVEATLQGFALDLVVERLHRRRPPVPEDIRQARKDAVEWLRRVSKGEVKLPAAATLPGDTTTTAGQAGGPERRVSRDTMGGL